MKFNFSGYATKNDLVCSDGRVIRQNAFKHQDGAKVPLVWQHLKNDPSNVLGHAILENRKDGVYAYCVFNDTESGKNAKSLVEHGDIETLSIHANKLKQIASDVIHGMIREVSLVVAGANPGAKIDNVCVVHADGSEITDPTEVIIHADEQIDNNEIEYELKMEDDSKEDNEEGSKEEVNHEDGKSMKDMTVREIFDTFTEEQKQVVYVMIGYALDGSEDKKEMKQSADEGDTTVGDVFHTLTDIQKEVAYAMIGSAVEEAEDMKQSAYENEDENNNHGGDEMKKNVFDGTQEKASEGYELTHADVQEIFATAIKRGSLKEAVLEHAGTYGIDNIDYLFPDAKLVKGKVEFLKRDTEWVSKVLSSTHKSPFSRIKSVVADITADEARAKGYVTGALKAEEVFPLLKRVTTPTTVYKKQKLDRDDIIDITDLNVVTWLKSEMRMMLNEEIARAILIGDQRNVAHADKINESNIRPIHTDDDMYAHKVTLANDKDIHDVLEAIIKARKEYKGSGSPSFYCTEDVLTDMLLIKDTTGRYIYENMDALAARLRVKEIVEVPVMDGATRVDGDDTHDLLGIIVNLRDYTNGADKGGKVSMFDDFDIDYNQYKYLIEGRMSGALTVPKSALVIEKTQAAG